ncbi:MAG: ATP-binding cassette domain-containing protein [Actinomycetota bacterium]
MPDGQVLEFDRVTKRFGAVNAVSDLSARVEPGVVTGFLGPNGAGKTTSLRMLLGLIRPTSGTATIGGQRYSELKHPLHTVGAALEASSFHPGRTAANHLKVYANAAGLPHSRIDAVLGLVGLADVAGRKVGGYSLGMRQRLGLATALLGDPGVVVLDEPANGLDPEGIRWMRTFLRQLAREGRTVLTSSHLLAEVQQTAQSLLIITQGRLVFQGGIHELSEEDETAVVVDSPDRAALVQALREAQIPFEVLRAGLTVRGADTAQIGALAAGSGIALSSLQKRGPALEEIFLELVNGLRVHHSAAGISGSLEATAASQDTVDQEPTTTDGTPESTDTPDTTDAFPVADAPLETGEEFPADPLSDDAITADTADTADTTDTTDAFPVADAPLETGEEFPADAATDDTERTLPGAAGLAAAVAGFGASDDDESDDPTPRPVYHVATTGVIDVVPGSDPAEDDEQSDDESPDGENHTDENAPDTDSDEEGEQR